MKYSLHPNKLITDNDSYFQSPSVVNWVFNKHQPMNTPKKEQLQENAENIQLQYSKPTDLKKFCLVTSFNIKNVKGGKFTYFIYSRYELLSKYFPHKTFSVGQATLDFFHETFLILDGQIPMPSEYDEKGNKKSEYELNYINWLKQHKK
jgi:hypothetical protein